MSDDFAGEKTEPATPRKRQEARSRGQVAKSQDLSTALMLLVAFGVFYFVAESLLKSMSGIVVRSFHALSEGRVDVDSVLTVGTHGTLHLATIILPILLVFFVVSFGINVLQVGWTISPQAVAPNLGKLNPIKGLQRIFSVRGLVRLAFGIFKLLVVGTVLWFSFTEILSAQSAENFLAFLELEPIKSFEIGNWVMFKVGAQASAALVVLAILDFSFQRWQLSQDLRMTKQEVRDEHKNIDGDPKLKEKRRRMAQQLALQRMMHDVPKADVVITNPTHYSCAIRYDRSTMVAPVLLAKGKDLLALRIREIATKHDIPMVEEPPLARSLYASAEVGDEVPPELYGDVARVLAYVYQISRKRG